MEKPLVSIVIPCRNEEKFIEKCLNSIFIQDYPKNRMEILVVNGMSEDKTKQIVINISHKNPIVKLLENPKKITPAAFNIGIKKSKGSFIIIMGAHANYKNNYISKCIETSIKYKADNVGGIWKIMPAKNTIINKSIVFASSSIFGAGNAYYRRGYLKKIKEVDTVFGGCFKKDVFKKIGLFDENLVRSQDMELNIRLKKAGGKILLNPEIVVYYYPKSTLKEFFKHNFTDGIWAIYPLKFVKIPLKLRHFTPLFFILSVLLSALLGSFYYLFFWLFLLIIAFYLLFSLCFSINIAYSKKDLRYLFLMPITFACRHFGYGLGSLWGLIKLLIKK